MEDKALLKAAVNAGATLGAVYEWLDRVDAAGGATSISGVAACNSMLESLRGNRQRVDDLIMKPLRRAIQDQEGK